MAQSFEGTEVTEELLDTTTSVVFAIDRDHAEHEPGRGVSWCLTEGARDDHVIYFLVPYPRAVVLTPDIREDLSVFVVVAAHIHGPIGIWLDVNAQHLPVDQLLSDDLAHVAVAITADDIAVEREVLQTLFAHKNQGVPANDQVLESLVNDDTITRCRDLVHDHSFHLGE